MFREIKKWLQSIITIIFVTFGSDAYPNNAISALKSGDLLTQKSEDGHWRVVRVLQIDASPDGTRTAHCLTYEDTKEKISLKDVVSLKVRVFHAPIAEKGFLSN